LPQLTNALEFGEGVKGGVEVLVIVLFQSLDVAMICLMSQKREETFKYK